MMKAVIPAAGLGTRFLPLTKAQPKEMLPVIDRPCIQYVVEEAVRSGITDIVIITGRGKRAIENHFDRSIELEQRLEENAMDKELQMLREIEDMADIFYIRQKNPLGLGHAVLCSKKHIGKEPFAVLLGDDLIVNGKPGISQLVETFDRMAGKAVVGIERLPRESLSKYGVISGEEIENGIYHVDDLVEKPPLGKEPSDLAMIGRYVFPPEIFGHIEKTPPGIGGEIQLTDAMRLLAKQEGLFGQIVEGRRYDLGTWFDWLRANIELALERPALGTQVQSWLQESVCAKKP